MLKKHPDEWKADLDWFVDHMADKLYANQHKGGWQRESAMSLLCSLEKEVLELREALVESTYRPKGNVNDVFAIVKECADVANFAFMVADVLTAQHLNEDGIPPTAKAAGILPTTT